MQFSKVVSRFLIDAIILTLIGLSVALPLGYGIEWLRQMTNHSPVTAISFTLLAMVTVVVFCISLMIMMGNKAVPKVASAQEINSLPRGETIRNLP